MADQRKLKARTTPWPVAVQSAIAEAHREGYMLALAEVETCLYSGASVTDLVRSALHPGDEAHVQVPLELRVAMSGRRDA